MIYSRQIHWQFLEDELRAQTSTFKQKLETSAKYLLVEREELFVAQFLKIEEGEMVLKFSNKRGLPRKGEYLYCFTVPKVYRNYGNWGNMTYGELIKVKGNFTEAVCIWQAPLKDSKDFSIAGFRGIEMEFATNLLNASGMILLLGPNKPPYEYILNLQKIVKSNYSEPASSILDNDFQKTHYLPVLLDNRNNISDFILSQLSLNDTLILQGPPGTGKTYQIAEICKKLCLNGKSVLVTSLTNRALIEVVEKPALRELLKEHRIFKTKLSTDEAKDLPNLQSIKEISPQPGNLILSSFYITSGEATKMNNDQLFDYIIVDEASQALLAMFGAAKLLGKRNVWIGDTNQLPPVISLNEDKVQKKNYGAMVDGLKSLSGSSTIPFYQLTETYRLTKRSASFTGIFYNDSLNSKSKNNLRLSFSEMAVDIGKFLNNHGGPTLIKTDLEIGNRKTSIATGIVIKLVTQLLATNENLHISVLTYFVDTTKALQKSIYQSGGYHKNLLVETVSRVQGLTTDITIFLIPNSGYNRSLEKRLFNVATSRSKRHTIIIADKDILTSYPNIDENVKLYLQKLNQEFSFYLSSEMKMIENNANVVVDENGMKEDELST